MSLQRTTTGRMLTVEIDTSLAFEFLLTLQVFHDQKGYEYEVGNIWFEMIRQKTTPELLATTSSFLTNIHWECWSPLLGLVADLPAPRDVPMFLEYFKLIEPYELRLHLLGYYQRSERKIVPLDIIYLAAQGDTEAQSQYLKIPVPEDEGRQAYTRQLFTTDPAEIKTKLLTTLQQWYEQVFRSLEPQVRPILERDATTKRTLQSTMSPEGLIEIATNGLKYVAEPGVRRVLLSPSFVMRPWNAHTDYQDMMIFCYPVADESIEKDSPVPPARLVRLYKALADERRLRILKMLTSRSYSLQEIADEFGVSKTTMHYHLATLRTAGLVLAQPNENLYSLRQDKLSQVSELLHAYLMSHNDYHDVD